MAKTATRTRIKPVKKQPVHRRGVTALRRRTLAALKLRDAERAGRLLGHHVRRTGQIVAETLTKGKQIP